MSVPEGATWSEQLRHRAELEDWSTRVTWFGRGMHWLTRGDMAWAAYCFYGALMTDEGSATLEVIENPFGRRT